MLPVTFLLLLTTACNKGKADEDEETTDDEAKIEYRTTLKVGANKQFKTISEAAAAAKDSTLVEIDAGTYKGDVAKWTQNELLIRAVGGEVILDADGKHYDGKGIWEIDGGRVRVEGITFKNAKVPDQNGAGIRLTNGNLTVVNCHFLHCEMGLLTANFASIRLLVENSEFGYGGYGNGYSHNIYVGYIGYFSVSGSYFHHAAKGHLMKTRAAISIITNNRITDENDAASQASYEIDIPSGGQAVVVGNIIQQSMHSENRRIIEYAMEGHDHHQKNELYVAYNTILNSLSSDDALFRMNNINSFKVVVCNNLLQKNIYINDDIPIHEASGNATFAPGDLNNDFFPSKALYDKWKNTVTPDIDKFLSANLKDIKVSLVPKAEYRHPMKTVALKNAPVFPGAYQTTF
ncbi:MAG: hypothetical protein LBD35_06170 [Prevotellaceae bacterium]|jgi:hypothetical protein|nr:hypothetical protein [Prevotellaceae bacterium]